MGCPGGFSTCWAHLMLDPPLASTLGSRPTSPGGSTPWFPDHFAASPEKQQTFRSVKDEPKSCVPDDGVEVTNAQRRM